MYKELAEFIIMSLVDEPDQVRINEIEGRTTIVLEVTVADEDVGRVIGKNGRVVNAIRTLLQAKSGRSEKRVTLEVV